MEFKITRSISLLIVLIGIFVFGCGGATSSAGQEKAPEPSPADDGTAEAEKEPEPFDLQAAMAMEFEPLEKQEVKDPGGRWTGSVEAAAAPVVSMDEEGNTQIDIPVGTDSDVSCVVHAESIDVGGSIHNLFKMTSGHVSYQQIVPTVVKAVQGSPMVSTNGLYFFDEGDVRMVGTFKLVIYDHPDHPILCTHDELGYSASFLRVVEGFFSSFEANTETEEPDFEEVWVVYFNDLAVGFTKSQMSKNDDKTWHSESKTAMVIPRSPVDLMTQDEYTINTCDEKGYIVTTKDVSAESGEITINVDLERTKNGKYEYGGEVQGKKIEGTFKARKKMGLLHDFFNMERVKKILAKGGEETFTTEIYSANIDPTKAIEVKYEVKGNQEPKSISMHVGEMVMTGTADAEGNVNRIVMPMGGLEMVMKLVHSKGEH